MMIQGQAAGHSPEEGRGSGDRRGFGGQQQEQRQPSFIHFFCRTKGPREVFMIMLLYSMAAGCTFGIVPAIVTDRYARLNHGYSGPSCSTYVKGTKPQPCMEGSYDAQNAVSWSTFTSSILIFLTSAMVGSLSDRIGRRPLFLSGMGLGLLSPLFLVLLERIPTMEPTWYYVATAARGLVNWFPLSLSALADSVPEQWRASCFGLILAGVLLGFSFSPLLTLFFSNHAVAVFALLGGVAVFVFAVLFLPETLAVEQRDVPHAYNGDHVLFQHSRDGAGWCAWKYAIRTVFRPITAISILNRNFLFRLLALLSLFTGMVFAADGSLEPYYAENQLDFTPQELAVLNAVQGVLSILVLGVLMKMLIQCMGEKRVIVVAYFFSMLNNILFGLARQKGAIVLAAFSSSFAHMSFPTISAIKANNVEDHEQGRIQGALWSVVSLSNAFGPLTMQAIFRATKELPYPGPGTMFLVAASLQCIAMGLACLLPRNKTDSSRINHCAGDPVTSRGVHDDTEGLPEPPAGSERMSGNLTERLLGNSSVDHDGDDVGVMIEEVDVRPPRSWTGVSSDDGRHEMT